MCNIEDLSKPVSIALVLLVKIMDLLSQFDSSVKFIMYLIEPDRNAIRVGVTIDLIIKKVPSFAKDIQKFFFQFKIKGKEGRRVFAKYYITHNKKITDIIETLKEELCEFNLCIKQ